MRRHSRAIDVLRGCTVKGSDRITEDTAVIIVAGWERVIALLKNSIENDTILQMHAEGRGSTQRDAAAQ